MVEGVVEGVDGGEGEVGGSRAVVCLVWLISLRCSFVGVVVGAGLEHESAFQ